MKTTNTFGVVFYLRKYKEKDGKAPIYVRITVDGKRVDIALKRDVDIKNKFCGYEEKEYSLISIFEYHNFEMKNLLEWGTQKNYFTTCRYVEEFLKARLKTSDVYLSQL